MISRIVDINVKTENLDQFTSALNEKYIPRIKQQPGFVDLIESIDRETGHFVCMTLWKSKEDVARYDSGLFQEIAGALVPLASTQPTVHTMQVENATTHNLSKGSSAAA
jgi:quinol monooxygenase YgiN